MAVAPDINNYSSTERESSIEHSINKTYQANKMKYKEQSDESINSNCDKINNKQPIIKINNESIMPNQTMKKSKRLVSTKGTYHSVAYKFTDSDTKKIMNDIYYATNKEEKKESKPQEITNISHITPIRINFAKVEINKKTDCADYKTKLKEYISKYNKRNDVNSALNYYQKRFQDSFDRIEAISIQKHINIIKYHQQTRNAIPATISAERVKFTNSWINTTFE